jgi:hypothetical protein
VPKQTFSLERGGSARLEVSWKAFWKEFTVRLDGKTIGVVASQKELSEGRGFTLPDGSKLAVQLRKSALGAELRMTRDGQPLPGSSSDPETQLKGAYAILLFVAGLNLVLGLIALSTRSAFLEQMGIGLYSVLFGGVFLILAALVKRGSLAALIVAIVTFIVDSLLATLLPAAQGYSTNTLLLVTRLFLLFPLIQAVGPMRTLKRK